jgi:hypothetical protein
VEKLPSWATDTDATATHGSVPCRVSSVTVRPAAPESVPATWRALPTKVLAFVLRANAGSTGPSAAGTGGAVPPLPANAAAGRARAALESASASPAFRIRTVI